MSKTYSESHTRFGTAKGYLQTIYATISSPLFQPMQNMEALHLLVGFFVELNLKAWLLNSGVPSHEVRKYSHDIERLFADCLAKGMPTVNRLDELVAAVSPSHKDLTYRYIDPVDGGIDPLQWPIVLPILDAFRIMIDTEIGASTFDGFPPGH